MQIGTFFVRAIILVTMQAILVMPIFADQPTEEQLVRFNCAQKELIDAQKRLKNAEKALSESENKCKLLFCFSAVVEYHYGKISQQELDTISSAAQKRQDHLKKSPMKVMKRSGVDLWVALVYMLALKDRVESAKTAVEAAKKEVESAAVV